MTMRAADERLIRRVGAGIMITAAAVALAGAVAGRTAFCGGVLAGGLVSWLNLRWVAGMVRKLLLGQDRRGFGLKLAFKELGLFTALGAIVALRLVDPVGLLIGLSGLTAGVVAAAVLKHRTGSNPEQTGIESRDKE